MLYESARLRLESVDRIATLWLDSPGGAANVLSLPLLHDLDRALSVVQKHPFINVLLIRSACSGVFLSGPHLDDVERNQDSGTRYGFADMGQRVLARLDHLSPTTATVAFIEGLCLNSGLELALACDFRLALAKPETLLGFDALERGAFPCWGATQRLPRLLGPERALDLLLTGRLLPARAAKQIGLVDHAFGPRPAKTELWSFLADLQDHPRRPQRRGFRREWRQRLREIRFLSRKTIFQPWAQRLTRPDQLQLLAVVERGWRFGRTAGFAAERAAFLALGDNGDCRRRREQTRTWERLRASAADQAKPGRIGIIGMSQAGIDLAVLALRFGGSVQLYESDAATRAHGRQQLDAAMRRSADEGWFNVVEEEQKRKSIVVAESLRKFATSEIVLITGAEDAQRRLIPALDAALPPSVVLAATSAPRPSLLRQLEHPERLVGLRFGAQPLLGKVVEMIPLRHTDDSTTARAIRWLGGCGKWVERAEPMAAPEPAVFAA